MNLEELSDEINKEYCKAIAKAINKELGYNKRFFRKKPMGKIKQIKTKTGTKYEATLNITPVSPIAVYEFIKKIDILWTNFSINERRDNNENIQK